MPGMNEITELKLKRKKKKLGLAHRALYSATEPSSFVLPVRQLCFGIYKINNRYVYAIYIYICTSF